MNRTEIANYALALVGTPRITDLSENTTTAQKVRSLIGISEDHVLRNFDWPSMTERATIARIEAPVSTGYEYAYRLPKMTRLLDIGGADYIMEGNTLYTNAETVTARYIKIPGETYDDTLLAEAIGLHLASRLAVDLSEDLTKRQTILQEFNQILIQAQNIARDEGVDAGQGDAWWHP